MYLEFTEGIPRFKTIKSSPHLNEQVENVMSRSDGPFSCTNTYSPLRVAKCKGQGRWWAGAALPQSTVNTYLQFLEWAQELQQHPLLP